MTGEGENKKTAYAATSLVGSVGDKTASKLTLSFSDIALDGRVKKIQKNLPLCGIMEPRR